MNLIQYIIVMIILLNSMQLKCVNGLKCQFINPASNYTCILKPDAKIRKEKHLKNNNDNKVIRYVIDMEKNKVSHISHNEYVIKRFRNIKSCDVIGIHSFTGNIFQHWADLQDLKILRTLINKIPENFFENNKKLKKLEIQENGNLKTLPENLFKNQKSLVELSLYYNEINYLPSNIFEPLTNLEMLDLHSNNFDSLDPVWFEKLKKLKILGMCCNSISIIEEDVFKPLINLEHLHLYRNKLKVLNSNSFGNHQYLSIISVAHNMINAVDARLFENTIVNEFDMTDNICSQENSETRNEMMENLKKCFQNFENLDSVCIKIFFLIYIIQLDHFKKLLITKNIN